MAQPAQEAEKIYYAIFKRKIPITIQSHFENISVQLNSRYSEDEINKYLHIVMKVNDLEAFELAARYLHKYPIVTEKFKIMVYLAETLPENYTIFINEQSRLIGGYISLVTSVARTIYKISKGVCLLFLYRL